VTLRHEGRPGDLGMVTYLHGVVYARGFGLETTFEPMWRACCPIFGGRSVVARGVRETVSQVAQSIVRDVEIAGSTTGQAATTAAFAFWIARRRRRQRSESSSSLALRR
jgi:hypothetical protein